MEISLEDFLKLNLKDETFIIETDTVYGIGCLYNSKIGSEKILSIKHRNNNKFFSILVSNLNQVKMLTKNYENALDIINKYWPGELTIIMEKSECVKGFVSSTNTVGLRMPNNENALKALEVHGPMIMTSLNISGEEPIIKYNDCLKFIDDVDYIVKGKDLSGIPSTVYNHLNKTVLRQGKIKISL